MRTVPSEMGSVSDCQSANLARRDPAGRPLTQSVEGERDAYRGSFTSQTLKVAHDPAFSCNYLWASLPSRMEISRPIASHVRRF